MAKDGARKHPAWLQHAKLLRMHGQRKAAIKLLRRAVQRFTDNNELRDRLARAHRRQSNLADAARLYWQLYEKADQLPAKLEQVGKLAGIARQRGRIRQLVSRFEERARQSCGQIGPYMAMAEIHKAADNYQERRRALMQASRIKPEDATLLVNVARIERQQSEYDRALKTLERAANIEGAATGRIHRRMAGLNFRLGEPSKAYNILFDLAGGKNKRRAASSRSSGP